MTMSLQDVLQDCKSFSFLVDGAEALPHFLFLCHQIRVKKSAIDESLMCDVSC